MLIFFDMKYDYTTLPRLYSCCTRVVPFPMVLAYAVRISTICLVFRVIQASFSQSYATLLDSPFS